MRAVAARGDDWKDLSAIGKFQAKGEGTVWLKSNWFSSDRYRRSGVGRTVHNHVGVDLEIESLSIGIDA